MNNDLHLSQHATRGIRYNDFFFLIALLVVLVIVLIMMGVAALYATRWNYRKRTLQKLEAEKARHEKEEEAWRECERRIRDEAERKEERAVQRELLRAQHDSKPATTVIKMETPPELRNLDRRDTCSCQKRCHCPQVIQQPVSQPMVNTVFVPMPAFGEWPTTKGYKRPYICTDPSHSRKRERYDSDEYETESNVPVVNKRNRKFRLRRNHDETDVEFQPQQQRSQSHVSSSALQSTVPTTVSTKTESTTRMQSPLTVTESVPSTVASTTSVQPTTPTVTSQTSLPTVTSTTTVTQTSATTVGMETVTATPSNVADEAGSTTAATSASNVTTATPTTSKTSVTTTDATATTISTSSLSLGPPVMLKSPTISVEMPSTPAVSNTWTARSDRIPIPTKPRAMAQFLNVLAETKRTSDTRFPHERYILVDESDLTSNRWTNSSNRTMTSASSNKFSETESSTMGGPVVTSTPRKPLPPSASTTLTMTSSVPDPECFTTKSAFDATNDPFCSPFPYWRTRSNSASPAPQNQPPRLSPQESTRNRVKVETEDISPPGRAYRAKVVELLKDDRTQESP